MTTAADYRTAATILEATAERSGFSAEDLVGPRRQHGLCWWRHVAMHAARQATFLSFPALGSIFHRDHTTVWYAVARIDQDPDGLRVARDLAATASESAPADCG